MSLSAKAKEFLEVAMSNAAVAKEVATAIDSLHAVTAAGTVAAIKPTTNLPASAMVAVDPAAPTAAEVDTAIDTLKTAVEARLDAIETKLDAVIASLKAASLMA